MYTYDEKLRAITLYFKYESYAVALNELGYPSRGALRKWVYEFEQNGDMKKALTRRPKYSLEQKQEAVNHYLEYGKCYSRTCRMLGYPSRALLTQWVLEMADMCPYPITSGLLKNSCLHIQRQVLHYECVVYS